MLKTNKMNFDWPTNDAELTKACNRFQVCQKIPPESYSYTPYKSILQDGPQCGLIALAMFCNLTTKQQIDNLLKIAQSLNFTVNGEMFSAEDMCNLTKKMVNKKVELRNNNLLSDETKEFLLNKGVILVPYDADANHSPCLKNGHKAHWALILGIIICEDIYVLCRQGKSKHLGIWSLQSLALSNAQLNEFSPSRKNTYETYKLPEGGISGPKGLKNKYIFIYPE